MIAVLSQLAGVAAALSMSACAGTYRSDATLAGPPDRSSFASAAEQICHGYAESQKALAVDLMYAQCMYARGYVVPGFSTSPNSPGYQGGLPGPGAIGGGH